MMRTLAKCWLGTGLAALAGCSDVTATNPYDPATPAAQREPGRVQGALSLPDGFDRDAAFADPAVVLLVDATGEARSATIEIVDDDEALDGRFTFDAVRAGVYLVRPRVPGFVAADVPIQVDIAQRVRLPALPLEAPTSTQAIEGVAHLDGADPAGHRGILVEADGTPFTAATNAEGRFHLPISDGSHTLRFGFAGYDPETRDVEVDAGVVRLDAPVLLRGLPGDVRGAVLPAADYGAARSLAGANVKLRAPDDPDAQPVASAPVGPDGAFLVDAVPLGTWALQATSRGFASPPQVLTITPGVALTAAALRLEPVVDAQLAGRATLAGADTHGGVEVIAVGTPHATTTGPDGAWALDVPAGVHTLRFAHPGYEAATAEIEVDADARAEAEPVALAGLPGRIRGTVSAPDGFDDRARLAATVVRLLDPAGDEVTRASPDAATLEFVMPDVAPGAYALRASLAGLDDRELPLIRVAPGETLNVGDLQLAAVDVADPDGISLVGEARLDPAPAAGHGGVLVQVVGTPYRTQTDEVGAYLLRVPPREAEYRLRFALRGFGSEEVGVAADEPGLPPDRVVTVDTVTLSGLPASVSGLVGVELGGEVVALAGADVRLFVAGEDAARSEATDAEGRFAIRDLPAGAHTLRVEHADFAAAERLVQVDWGEALALPTRVVLRDEQPPRVTALRVLDGGAEVDVTGAARVTVEIEVGGAAPGEDLEVEAGLVGFVGALGGCVVPAGQPGCTVAALDLNGAAPAGVERDLVVRAVAIDAAGNRSEPRERALRVDRRPPALPQIVALDGPLLTSTQVRLQAQAADAVDVRLGGDLTGPAPDFVALGLGRFDVEVERPPGPGPAVRTVTAVFRDAVGNEATPVEAEVRVDTSPPGFDAALRSAAGDPLAPGPDQTPPRVSEPRLGVVITPTAADDSDCPAPFDACGFEVRASTDPQLRDAPWGRFASSLTLTLPPLSGTYEVFVQLRDPAGNVAEARLDVRLVVEVDRIGPAVPGLRRTYIAPEKIRLELTPPADPDVAWYRIERNIPEVDGGTWRAVALHPAADDALPVEALAGLPALQQPDCVDATDCLAYPAPGALLLEDRAVYPGLAHAYRVRAVDDLGNASAVSAPIDAGIPLRPARAALLRHDDQRVVSWRTPAGAFQLDRVQLELLGQRDQTQQSFEFAPVLGALDRPGARIFGPEPGMMQLQRERLRLEVSNPDRSVRWRTTITGLGLSPVTVDERPPPASYPRIALTRDATGAARLLYRFRGPNGEAGMMDQTLRWPLADHRRLLDYEPLPIALNDYTTLATAQHPDGRPFALMWLGAVVLVDLSDPDAPMAREIGQAPMLDRPDHGTALVFTADGTAHVLITPDRGDGQRNHLDHIRVPPVGAPLRRTVDDDVDIGRGVYIGVRRGRPFAVYLAPSLRFVDLADADPTPVTLDAQGGRDREPPYGPDVYLDASDRLHIVYTAAAPHEATAYVRYTPGEAPTRDVFPPDTLTHDPRWVPRPDRPPAIVAHPPYTLFEPDDDWPDGPDGVLGGDIGRLTGVAAEDFDGHRAAVTVDGAGRPFLAYTAKPFGVRVVALDLLADFDGPVEEIDAAPPERALGASLAATRGPDGAIHVVYRDAPQGAGPVRTGDLYYRRLPDAPVRIEDSGEVHGGLRVVVTATGEVVVGYRRVPTETIEVLRIRDGVVSEPESVGATFGAGASDSGIPFALHATRDGRLHLVWFDPQGRLHHRIWEEGQPTQTHATESLDGGATVDGVLAETRDGLVLLNRSGGAVWRWNLSEPANPTRVRLTPDDEYVFGLGAAAVRADGAHWFVTLDTAEALGDARVRGSDGTDRVVSTSISTLYDCAAMALDDGGRPTLVFSDTGFEQDQRFARLRLVRPAAGDASPALTLRQHPTTFRRGRTACVLLPAPDGHVDLLYYDAARVLAGQVPIEHQRLRPGRPLDATYERIDQTRPLGVAGDGDEDGIPDDADSCPQVWNPLQRSGAATLCP